jgi:hypothetical protein
LAYIEEHHPGYFLPVILNTLTGESMFSDAEKGYFRLFSFVKGSYTHAVADNPLLAYEAARQFGLFASVLSSFPVHDLRYTIPQFHDLTLRYTQFMDAMENGNKLRISESENEIKFILDHNFIVKKYQDILSNSDFKLRVTHHDTKISNILFDKSGNGLCVVDLDTVMPGYFTSDVGDMMRTYLCSASEEENDFSQITVRTEYFIAIMNGYLGQMATILTQSEIESFTFSGLMMTYMQALRFLTDHLNNDVYYGAKYTGHNFIRAKNQLTLLKKLIDLEDRFNEMVRLEWNRLMSEA